MISPYKQNHRQGQLTGLTNDRFIDGVQLSTNTVSSHARVPWQGSSCHAAIQPVPWRTHQGVGEGAAVEARADGGGAVRAPALAFTAADSESTNAGAAPGGRR
jgi:hypothetical protein